MGDAVTHLPGSWLVKLSAKLLDAASVTSLVEPTIADLQHEVARAGRDVWRARSARLHGYSAVARLLFTSSLFWRTPMRRMITVVSLGWVGAALFYLVMTRSTPDIGPLTPFFVMAVLTPLVLRQMNLASSFRAAFVNCLGVGVLMGTALYSLVIWKASASWSRPQPWYAFVLSYAFLLACIAVGSGVAAAVASRVATGTTPVQHTFRHVAAGCMAYAVCDALLRLSFGASGAMALGWASFLGFYFACVSLLVYVPVLLGARRLVPHGVMLALIGALLCPVPVLAFPALQGRFHTVWAYWLATPSSLMWSALPYLVGGAVLGWLLAAPSRQAVQPPLPSTL